MGSWSGKKGLYGYILCIFLALWVFHEFQIHSYIHSFIQVLIQQTYVLGVNNLTRVRDTRQTYREISKSVQSTWGKRNTWEWLTYYFIVLIDIKNPVLDE